MANEFKIKKGLIVTGASGGTVVDIQGSQGQLFSVTDDLSGSIFAVSDISGVPIFDVNSSGLSTFDGLVSGITPVNAANFVTKAYVDGTGGGSGPFLPLAGGTMTGTNGVVFPDNFKLKLGTSSDLEIFHDGSNSYIRDNGIGDLRFMASNIKFYDNATAELMAQMIPNGAVELYYDNVKKFETTTFGSKVTGYIQVTNGVDVTGGNIDLLDNSRIRIGTSQDLQIYHDGSNSYITDSGTGNLRIRSTSLRLENTDSSNMVVANGGGNVAIYYNGSAKFSTTNTGVSVTGDVTASGTVNADTYFQSTDASAVLATNGAGSVFLRPNGPGSGTGALSVVSSGNVNALGTVTAPTFSGDLNGTINTVTTAVTKANATNDTTVATTAFVQNLIGTIPAGLVFQGTWNASTNTPTLTSGTGTTGNFYIVSVDGSTNLDGITDWKVGDWAVFIEQGASDQWEKIDNSSVLDGIGTGGRVTKWSGSGTSNTLTDSGISDSSNALAIIINGNEEVGIGGSPLYKLDVFGNLRVSTTSTLTGTVNVGTTATKIVLTPAGDAYMTTTRAWQLSAAIGNTTYPTYGFYGNTGTGMYSAATDTLAFSTSAVERARITSTGHLQVSTGYFELTSQPTTKLWLSTNQVQLYAGNLLVFGGYNASNDSVVIGNESGDVNVTLAGGANDKVLYLEGSSGNVGIGTKTPLAKLDIQGTQGQLFSVTDNLSGSIFAVADISGVPIFDVNSSGVSYFDGNVGIGDTTPSYKLDVDGTIRATGDVIAYSDVRVKENIKTIDNSLEKVSKLRGVEFNKIGDNKKSIGVIAQEIEKVIPEVVKEDDKGMKSVAYGNISGLLIEAIKELKTEMESLKLEIKTLKNK